MSKRIALGFFAGVRAFFGGLGFVVGTPSAWGWALIPVLVATLLFGGAGALAIWGGSELSQRVIGDGASGAWSSIGVWTLRILFWAIGVVVAFVIAMSLAQPLSGFALDAIARKQEVALGGRTWPDQPFAAAALRSLRVTLTALVIGLPILAILAVITFVFPPAGVVAVPLKFVVTGVLVAYDLLDYPLSLRGHSVGDRLSFIRRNFPAVLGFGVATAALLLIPGVGLLLLPFGVAGATRMVAAADRADAQLDHG
ncbi:MAG: Sulfate transport system protein cysZ [Labilithrix sp.]|nr:Sulfate transport system protein cysZ [Labilithrix sp.]